MQSAVRGMGEKTVAVQCSKAFKVRHKYKAILSTSNQNQLIHQSSFKSSIFFCPDQGQFLHLIYVNELPTSEQDGGLWYYTAPLPYVRSTTGS